MTSARPVRVRTVVLPMIAAALLCPRAGVGQGILPRENGQALAGVTSFFVWAGSLIWSSQDDGYSQETFDSKLSSAFELGLRRDGVSIVETYTEAVLHCQAHVVQNGGGVTAFWAVKYFRLASTGVHSQQWESEGFRTGPLDSYPEFELAEAVAKACGDAFANEWLKWNPRRTP